MNRKLMCVAAIAALALAACGGGGGGGGGDEATELAMVPDEALATGEAFTDWVGARQASDANEPLAMNAMMPPSSDTAEPVDLD
jgi:hypothetical protein